ncbi:unnamed protein product [Caenorhabditis brenneri]
MVMVKPIIKTDGCTTTVYCEGDYDLVIFDEKTDTVFGQYSADGLCDARTQTWQVAVDAGFQAFKRLYGMCTYYLRGNSTECTPHRSQHTFFLAYSNDVNKYTIFDIADEMKSGGIKRSSYYTHFATVRFDLTSPGPVQYTTDWTVAHTYISNNLPESSLSYPNEEAGSDVLESVILKFLDNKEVPLCGASIIILMKRYPGPTSVEHSELVNRLREFNIQLHIFFSIEPYGTPDQFDLYDLAAKTNGFFGYIDEYLFKAVMKVGVPILATSYQIYAVNREVSGSVVTWTAPDEAGTADSRKCVWDRKGNNYCSKRVDLPENTYTMELEYNVSKPTTLMVRAYSRVPIPHWIPFDL